MRPVIVQERLGSIGSTFLIAELEEFLAWQILTSEPSGMSPEQVLTQDVPFFVARVNRPAAAGSGSMIREAAVTQTHWTVSTDDYQIRTAG